MHLLEVDKLAVKRLAALVKERQVFEQQRCEGDQWRSQAGDQVSVGLVVPGRVRNALKLLKLLPELPGETLPGES